MGKCLARAGVAIEGSGSLGRGVAQFLARNGERVHEVNPRWTAQRRRGLRRPGKTDALDAQAVARLLRDEGESLPLVQAEEPAVASLQLWSRLREDLVLDMTRLRNRLHALLLLCDPEYRQVIRSLRSRRGTQAARTYTAPGIGQLERAREQAVHQVAEQIMGSDNVLERRRGQRMRGLRRARLERMIYGGGLPFDNSTVRGLARRLLPMI